MNETKKELANVNLYISGDPTKGELTGAMMTYDVIVGKGKKPNNTYVFEEFDSEKSLADLWSKGIKKIKKLEKF